MAARLLYPPEAYSLGGTSNNLTYYTGSLIQIYRLMRRTGKLYTLTLASAGLSVLANILVATWNDRTSTFHLWYDIVPQGFGMASLITSTLIVSRSSFLRNLK